MKNEVPYKVLLYYKYVLINEPETYAKLHLKFCDALGIKGRIIIAGEGINGTLSGTKGQTDTYIHAMRMDPRFTDVDFKIDEASEHVFKKLYVRSRKEIVTLNLERNVDPNVITGKYLNPIEFFQAMDEEDTFLLDARNDYEYDLGHFKKAVGLPIKNFKQVPEWIKNNLDKLRGKKIVTYCTGGIRCEKFSALLLKEGIKEVYQLKGGIINYSQDPITKGAGFVGKCYVFDERISVEVNGAEGYTLIGKCYHCSQSCDRYVNCAHLSCHFQFICCDACEVKYKRSCSIECESAEDHEWKIEKYKLNIPVQA